ncbi:MAG: response regulator [Candidatus Eremiobacteraeota bacterium]|nr:response regulator [Candidatus Eremiobacteraeota bacterium]
MRVLVVEDNPADALLVQEYLRVGTPPIQTRVAPRVADAIKTLASEPMDAVLLDMTLPDADGLEAVRKLRDAHPNVPIVILSGGEDEKLATDAVQAGAQDYLVKGHVDELMLRRALRYSVERQQLLERVGRSEAKLQEENVLLRRVADAAGRVFSTLDPRAIVNLLMSEARRMWGKNVTLYALRSSGELAFADGPKRGAADGFLRAAFNGRATMLAENRDRLALPICGTSGRNEWLLDVRGVADERFGENDVFALELLRHYIDIAIQNVALFGELQSQRANVLHLNQLKDDMIAVLAHDFKGPLTTIIGFTELLEQRMLEGDESDNALRTIRNSATRLAGLANDTLAISRVEQGELNLAADPVNVADIVTEIADGLRATRDIHIENLAREPIVRGDPARLHQVFENIVGNAVKYSEPETPVSVRISENENSLRVSVSDRGIGVPSDQLKFLFERFTRASNAKKSKIKGTGLGLYLAKTLVERHGGNIEVQSTLGEGSTFTIVLPRLSEGTGGLVRALLITGDENIGPFVLHELRSHGYAARWDKLLSHALERLEVETFDVVIIDRDSIGDVKTLEQRAREAPFALVGIGPSRDERAPWFSSLPKPFLASQLHAALARATVARRSIGA